MIRLDDGKPWFRRWMWIGYRPITHEGRVLISAAGGVSLFAGCIALATDGKSPWTELALGAAVITVLATTAIALFKMEDNYF